MKPPNREDLGPIMAHYSGIKPRKGWPARNLRFLRRAGNVLEPVADPPTNGEVRITWIGHASFYLQFAGHSVIVDPNWANWDARNLLYHPRGDHP